MRKWTEAGAEPAPPGLESPLDAAVTQRDRGVLGKVRRAVEAGDVLLAFQPVVRADDAGAVAFYEGLVRIPDDDGRIIPARDFIQIVEMQELGRRIDCLALEMGLIALGQAPGLRLSINMSARSIGYPRWTHTLHAGLASDPRLAERLILEITETSAMVLPDLVSTFMHDLQARGIAFALDDFGGGQTSFRHLRDFSFDLVKIDGEFTGGIAGNADNQVLVQALVSIARQFDMFTVATAIESAHDAAFLSGIGVDCLQGYYFGAPTIRPPWLQPARKAV